MSEAFTVSHRLFAENADSSSRQIAYKDRDKPVPMTHHDRTTSNRGQRSIAASQLRTGKVTIQRQ